MRVRKGRGSKDGDIVITVEKGYPGCSGEVQMDAWKRGAARDLNSDWPRDELRLSSSLKNSSRALKRSTSMCFYFGYNPALPLKE